MRVGLTAVLDEGWLTFDTIRLTSLSAPISARPEQYHKLAAQVSGQLNSAGDGRLFVQYSNGTIHNVWQNDDVFNGSQNITGNFTTPANVSSFQVGTEVVLDKGHLNFDDLTLTAYSNYIEAAPSDWHRLTAEITGELDAGWGQGGQIWVVYENLAGQTLSSTLLWSNPADFSGMTTMQADFNPGLLPPTVVIRIALETNLDAGHLAFSNFELQHLDNGNIIRRRTYSIAGQPIAIKVTGDPELDNNGLFFLYSDHLGSANAMQHPDGSVTQTRYLPFGGYRSGGSNPITDRGYTGHKHNDSLGLIYMNARYYSPNTNRMISPDTIVPDPSNPQSYNRYSYVRNSPLNRIDPTGHVDCNLLDGGVDTQACNEAKIIGTNAGAMSTPCNNCPGYNAQFGDMQAAYNVFVGLEQELGRPATYQEVLAIVAFHEFGKLIRNDDEYNIALEAMGRQFYNFCGPSSVCQGDELWKFLGAQQSWTKANPVGLAEELRNGIIEGRDFTGAQRVLNQPSYDPANTTAEQMKSNWRSGNGLGNVPFKYGNYSMFPAGVRVQLAEVPQGINGLAVTTVYLNRPDLNNGNGYVVMTHGQYNYWTSR